MEKTAHLNTQLGNYLVQRPLLWVMHLLQDIFEANGHAFINALIRQAWLRIMKTMPTSSMFAEELKIVQNKTRQLEQQIAEQATLIVQQQQLAAEQARQIAALTSTVNWLQAHFVYDVYGVMGAPDYPYTQPMMIDNEEEYIPPVSLSTKQPEPDAMELDEDEEGLALITFIN
ncbi:MAG: hypothetical protein ACRCXC_10690 [Legionella sp.]